MEPSITVQFKITYPKLRLTTTCWEHGSKNHWVFLEYLEGVSYGDHVGDPEVAKAACLKACPDYTALATTYPEWVGTVSIVPEHVERFRETMGV